MYRRILKPHPSDIYYNGIDTRSRTIKDGFYAFAGPYGVLQSYIVDDPVQIFICFDI